MKTSLSLISAALILMGTLPGIRAQVIITGSNTDPTPGADWVFNTDGSGSLDGGTDFTDNNPRPGQTFTTGSFAGGYLLNSISFRRGSSFGGDPTQLSIRVGEIVPPSEPIPENQMTNLFEGTVTFSPTLISDFTTYTFTFDTPIALAPDTLHGFTIWRSGGSGWIGWEKSASDVLPEANAIGVGFAFNEVYVLSPSTDRVFWADLTAVPEPSILTLLGVGGAAALACFRRRRTS